MSSFLVNVRVTPPPSPPSPFSRHIVLSFLLFPTTAGKLQVVCRDAFQIHRAQ